MQGTSQASPHVTGVALLAQQLATGKLGRRLHLAEFNMLLAETSVVINDGNDEDDNVENTGLDFRRVDMVKLAEGISQLEALPETHTVVLDTDQSVEKVDFGNRPRNVNPPLADPDGPYSLCQGQDLGLDASGSYDPDSWDAVVKYEWDLDGDDEFDDAVSTEPVLTVPWSELGSFPVGQALSISLRVMDNYEATDIAPTTLTIHPIEPVAEFAVIPNPAAPGQRIAFDAGSSHHGCPQHNIVQYEWDFGDERTATGVQTTHSYGRFGSYTVQLTVTDDNLPPRSDTATMEIKIEIGNHPPIADANGPYLVEVGGSLSLDAVGSRDPDTESGDSIVLYEWDLESDGSYEYTGSYVDVPWEDLAGLPRESPVSVTLQVHDSLGLTDTDVTTLEVHSNEPVATLVAHPDPAACNQEITFDASSSHHEFPERGIVKYSWDLDNDGQFDDATGVIVAHAFSAFGSYTVALKVTDDNVPAKTDTTTRLINVSLGNRPPVADPGGPYSIDVGDGLILDAVGSHDPDGACGDGIVLYEWDLDADSVAEYTGSVVAVPWAELQEFILPSGEIPVSLRVTDTVGSNYTASTSAVVGPQVLGRHVFYNSSTFDGNAPAANAADDSAIAIDKQALLPGQSATFDHYTSYSLGINGIMVDLGGVPDEIVPDADNFQFTIGNSNDPATWLPAPEPIAVTLRENAGVNESDRVTIVWEDRAITKCSVSTQMAQSGG